MNDSSSPAVAPGALARLRLRWDLRRALAGIDRAGFEEIRAGFEDTPNAYRSKYWDLRYQLLKNLNRARHLGLHRPPAGLRVLDLGTGFGYFPLVCRHYGHNALGLDFPDEGARELYSRVTSFLGVDRVIAEIEPYQPLPDLGQRFDLVTAFAVLFNGAGRQDPWGAEQWEFLLTDLASRHPAPGGAVFLALNQDREGRYYPPDAGDLFRRAGASLQDRFVYFRDLRNLARAQEN